MPELIEKLRPLLIAALRDTNAKIRRSAASDLGRVKPALPETVPALVRALDDPERQVQIWATLSLWQFGSGAAEAIPPLRRLQRSKDAELANTARRALEAIQKK